MNRRCEDEARYEQDGVDFEDQDERVPVVVEPTSNDSRPDDRDDGNDAGQEKLCLEPHFDDCLSES
jgi:hypothetical protein